MEKNPFSFYDFLGYLFPGLIALLAFIHIIFLGNPTSISEYFSITEFMHTFRDEIILEWWTSTLIIIVLSYVLGHIISYSSSISIEYLTNGIYNYPSNFLLHNENKSLGNHLSAFFFKEISDSFQRHNNLFGKIAVIPEILGKLIWRITIFIVLFPISFFLIIFGNIFGINRFITRPLDEYIRNGIQNKLYELADKLNVSRPNVNSHTDYHRIVMHYVYYNIPNSNKKAENYVALYGFLRAMSFICCIYTDFLIIKAFCIIKCRNTIDCDSIILILAMIVLSNILFMSFNKFYRRFTLENYMALLTEKNL